MYDIKPLEEEWKRYKKKKMRPWYVLFAVIFSIILIPIVFLNYNNMTFPEFNIKSNIKKDTDVFTTVLLIDKPLTELETKKVEISDSNIDIRELKPIVAEISHKGTVEILVEDLPISDDIQILKKPKVNKKIKIVEKPRKKMHLNIIETSSVSAYKDVAKRFKQSHDTDDSLFLAQSYYKRGNYKKAEYWSLQTNKVNKKIDESWLIFVKSKVKLGHKNEAEQILISYIKKSNSTAAKNLLYKIKKGTF